MVEIFLVPSIICQHEPFDSNVYDAGILTELKATGTLESYCTLNPHPYAGQFLLSTLLIYILYRNFMSLGLYCFYFWDELCLVLYYCFDILLGSVST